MGFFKSIPAFLELFKEGREIDNSATWKNRTIATNAVVALLGTLVVIGKNFGYDLQLDPETLTNLGGGVVALVAVVNGIMHVVTSSKVGVPSGD